MGYHLAGIGIVFWFVVVADTLAKEVFLRSTMTSKIEEAFKLKANFLPITVIKFIRLDPRNVLQQLKEIQLSAPNYFHQSPVVIDLSQFKRSVKNLDLAQLTQLLRENDLIP